jgi:hypothetical protein
MQLIDAENSALVKILEERRLQAGLEHLTWHDFWRTYISDLVTTQKIVGYSSANIISKYNCTWQNEVKAE